MKLEYHCWKTDNGMGVSGLFPSITIYTELREIREFDIPTKGMQIIEQLSTSASLPDPW